ncbi:carbohydrate ABC transporter membrane protein 1 (CUT1 family) [Micromonospora pisi]|uniref:Carbohydrate ABC transporter membrane protein 1 (CUT1 family) n=1 Tax=Micromonospora pisi TaxID=589240 RepID=A0A495JS32_9ACTN|nr:sugar ABC transporter permease [Micromonospora pisi]RKR91435.1 carbohydrate ABC transporter membrane protein 1 (CUT1 family) [Micromonospora pisi]
MTAPTVTSRKPPDAVSAGSSPKPAASGRGRNPREAVLALLFLVPGLAGLGVFVIFPLFQAVYLSTRGNDILGNPTRSVGLAHFAELFTPTFGGLLGQTFVFVLLVVVPGVLLPLAIAAPLTQRLPGMKIFRTAFALPFAYSASAASVVWLIMLNPGISPVNWALGLVGIPAPDWTTDPTWAMITVAGVTVWMVSGFNLLVISAGLAGVDEEILEAARIDGAGGLRQFFSIVLPMTSPSLFFAVVTTTLSALQALGQVQIITDGGPNGQTRTLVYSIFDNAFHNNNSNFGLASAQGLVLLVVGVLIATVQFGVLERRVHYR